MCCKLWGGPSSYSTFPKTKLVHSRLVRTVQWIRDQSTADILNRVQQWAVLSMFPVGSHESITTVLLPGVASQKSFVRAHTERKVQISKGSQYQPQPAWSAQPRRSDHFCLFASALQFSRLMLYVDPATQDMRSFTVSIICLITATGKSCVKLFSDLQDCVQPRRKKCFWRRLFWRPWFSWRTYCS